MAVLFARTGFFLYNEGNVVKTTLFLTKIIKLYDECNELSGL